MLAAGAGLAAMGQALLAVEIGVEGSVLELGLLVAMAVRPSVPAAVARWRVPCFHGHTHGTELSPEASAGFYVRGFILALASLLGCGWRAGRALEARLAGTVLAGGGAWMLWG